MWSWDRRTLTVDTAIAAAAVTACLLLGLAGLAEWYWSALVAVTLVIRRSAPVVFLGLVAALSAIHMTLSGSFAFPGDLIDLVAGHAVAAYGPARLRHAGLLLGVAGGLVVTARALNDRLLSAAMLPAALIVAATLAAWSMGLMQRQQRAAVLDAQHRRRLAEQDSAMRARLATIEERTRISQEMHDIIAHSLASVIAQAEGGRVAARADAIVAGPLFDRIAHIGREALTDVKRLLNSIDCDMQGDDFAQGLRELPDLLGGVSAAGLDVTLEVAGEEQPLASGMDLAVYRVIQESLTNVLKHAPQRRALLRLVWTPARLEVTVTSPLAGAGGGSPREGRGLSGIRQRCSLFNGDCEITAGQDFSVVTRWPLTRLDLPVS
ncbi:sensor histidine kinase [Actinoplanes derwentensis]|uniref:histidine kinase n=1 Tax=Actinoplanes derwentensis TaxID=113562 RepID=A0A1H2DE77_9ACTN|nr:histidine kinase [Actinoplanes derwentensis]GID84823.1 two-component sensor histidine kinase [Actinoplanes derwentensis]SDT81011.1 Signal transduction histidine kinase [Actinoplanes derwentensis]